MVIGGGSVTWNSARFPAPTPPQMLQFPTMNNVFIHPDYLLIPEHQHLYGDGEFVFHRIEITEPPFEI